MGTIARTAAGLGLVYLGALKHGAIDWNAMVLGLILFPSVLLFWHRWRLRRTAAPLRATGPAALLVNHGVVVLLVILPSTRDAAALFYGASMILAAVRGYAGCEVLAISNWLLGRNDQVGCLLFSPIDAIESQARRRA